jgi:hypothetical protein
MMGNVDTMNLIAFGIGHIAIEGTPTKTEGGDEEIIEEPDIARYDGCTTYPPSPGRDLL